MGTMGLIFRVEGNDGIDLRVLSIVVIVRRVDGIAVIDRLVVLPIVRIG